jgi:hypothetical protein
MPDWFPLAGREISQTDHQCKLETAFEHFGPKEAFTEDAVPHRRPNDGWNHGVGDSRPDPLRLL